MKGYIAKRCIPDKNPYLGSDILFVKLLSCRQLQVAFLTN